MKKYSDYRCLHTVFSSGPPSLRGLSPRPGQTVATPRTGVRYARPQGEGTYPIPRSPRCRRTAPAAVANRRRPAPCPQYPKACIVHHSSRMMPTSNIECNSYSKTTAFIESDKNRHHIQTHCSILCAQRNDLFPTGISRRIAKPHDTSLESEDEMRNGRFDATR